jgi:phosphomevalonate kinase
MKLVLAGEYAVLDPGAPGVVAAVDRYATCTARGAVRGAVLTAPTLGAEVIQRAEEVPATGAVLFEPVAPEVGKRLVFARVAVELAYAYVAALGLAPRPLAVVCESDGGHVVLPATGERAKLGLGSSAATTIAVLCAVLAAHGVPIDRRTFRASILKLALLAHGRAQEGRGSGIDVAAAMQGGVIEYTRPEPLDAEHVDRGLIDIVRGGWPGLSIEPLPVPRGLRLLVGYAGAPSSTTDLVAAVEAWKRDRPSEHRTFSNASQRAARALAQGLRRGDPGLIAGAVEQARRALVALGERTGLPIETPLLERLATIASEEGGCGKLSGAGGGDCGFAFAWSEESARRIEARWREAGITPVPLEIAPSGMQEMARP